MLRFLLFLLFPLGFSHSLKAQSAGLGLEGNVMVGRLFRHSPNFKGPVPKRPAITYELNFIKKTYGRQDWEQRRHYPTWGISIALTDYGIDSIYGKAISLCPNLEVPILRAKNLEWTARISAGAAIATRRFTRAPDFDTLNNMIGGRFNNFTILTTDLRLHLNDHWDVQAGADFMHMSNATIRTPNLGINRYGGHVGFRYFPVTSRPETMDDERPLLPNRWLVQARAGLAFTQSGVGDGPIYPVYLVSAFASKRYYSQNKVFVGMDYSYHEKIYAFLRNNEILAGKEKANSWKSGLFAGHEWLFGKGSILLQVGYYLRETPLKISPFYQKLGGQFYILKQEKGLLKEVSLYGLLKTHLTQAELAEFGLGIGI